MLSSGVVGFHCDHFSSAPQLKRDPLGCAGKQKQRIVLNPTRERLLPAVTDIRLVWIILVEAGFQAVPASWRARGAAAGELRAAFHPAVRTRVLIEEAVSRRP